ncbi:SGNH/GDSL hydrolase family protein [Thermomonospora catenispora]|uniref:SGNH/GDSL hydrolase family protein n=1 Tax=Thermomonospora catenispora TaxID=2493090 RepID=UPI0011225A09|nr:SGNH/GDSL hydrolase family protein [Thermomonospora catenispora]TNY34953.1 SGNH/GDSL hydrolase family protein [Thermomonospora catenispora]
MSATPPGIDGIDTYVAIGDSFTEGLQDPDPVDPDRFRGWADRLAEHIAAHRPGLRYANLAVRGKLLRQIVADQVPRAVEMRPDLVTFCGGGNDMLRPGADPDALAVMFDEAVQRLRGTGARVVIFTGFDPQWLRAGRRIRGKAATYSMHLRAIADRRGCLLVDLWPRSVLYDPRAWHEDRLHLSSEGHRRLALLVCERLGVPVEGDWREPWPAPVAARSWHEQRREDLYWARTYFLPWIQRRIQGRSSGDGRPPKRPDLLPV